MLGSVVYQVLAGYLGHYVKDMQREQFRIGLWSGRVSCTPFESSESGEVLEAQCIVVNWLDARVGLLLCRFWENSVHCDSIRRDDKLIAGN